MVVTLGGNLNVGREEHLLNALLPILVTFLRSSSFIAVSDEHPEKADNPMLLREDGSFTELSDLQLRNTFLGRSTTPSGMVMVFSAMQPEKAVCPISTTPEGMLICTSALQLLKEWSPIISSVSGSVTFLSLVHCWKTPIS